jgi:hypothetical protein
MVEACPVCDTLWRLYTQAANNLHNLVEKHGETRGKGDQNSIEVLSHEITIVESTLRIVRREIRRHEVVRHGNPQGNQKTQSQEQPQNQQK